MAGWTFEAVAPEVEELRTGDPGVVVVINALRKAHAGAAMIAGCEVVVGVDTDVAIDGELLGKAAEEAGAIERLERLSGRSHEVLSGVALLAAGDEHTELVSTRVTFRQLRAAEVSTYVGSGEWRDRAGAYAVQGLGSAFVERVEGDLSNVIGLPIPTLSRMIAALQNR